jgi:hypothetical protein
MNRNDDHVSDREFDARLRDTWRTAIDAVPPTVARRLRPAVRETRAPSRWPLGAAFAAAAVVALAIGLRPHPATSPTAAPAPAVATINAGDATAALDRNPDFYAWLASPDAEQLAME